MSTKEELHTSLECINETFSISIKSREMRELGLLEKGDDIIHQSAKLGELMWARLWNELCDDLSWGLSKSPKNVLDRGEPVVVRSSRDQP